MLNVSLSRRFSSWIIGVSPEWYFLVIALTFGLATMIVTPPFQVPDEFHHFYRAYQVAEGQIIPVQKDSPWEDIYPLVLSIHRGRFGKFVWLKEQMLKRSEIIWIVH
jgi:hypothetical protein